LALLLASKRTIAYGYLLVVIGVAIFASSLFMLSLLRNQFAYDGTFPGENGKIAFGFEGKVQGEIYVMNADGTNHTRRTSNHAYDIFPS
jgi:hypothetical protein